MTNTTSETAAALRSALKSAFPAATFSVRMARGTAYGWIDVTWTDGPTEADVRAITRRFESSRFDGMDDSYHRTGNAEWSCCGVTTQRRYSADRQAFAQSLVRTNGQGERYINHGGATAWQIHGWDTDDRIAREWLGKVAS